MRHLYDSTICAPATRAGGAISVIRVSGAEAVEIADKVVRTANGTHLSSSSGYTLHYCKIEYDGKPLDDVVVSVFRAPKSYTGEDSVEISCHGSEYIVSKILELLISAGAVPARPGEFTQRAFVAGKMDLAQAEAVADLIASQTAASHRIAINQLKGGFSSELTEMRSNLLQIVSLMELELDFSEEDVEFADREELKSLLDKSIDHITSLISSFTLGNAIKNGVPVAIVGATNAGKSTLLNAIIGENRAIVSDIAGTTRDTIEETYNIDGVLFRFIDTAGLRESLDRIESIGIERAYEKIEAASLVIALCDLTTPLKETVRTISDISSHLSEQQKLIFALNKTDLVSQETGHTLKQELLKTINENTSCTFSSSNIPIFEISAINNTGIKELTSSISTIYRDMDTGTETTLVTNIRHLEALKSAKESLLRVRLAIDSKVPTDLVSQDLREALYHLGTITGEITTDEVLGNIFSKFCIGK